MSVLNVEYGGSRPSDFTFVTATTPHKGQFGQLNSSKELKILEASGAPFAMFLEDHDAVQNSDRKISIVTNWCIVKTDIFDGAVGDYTVGSAVYGSVTTGQIEHTGNSGANPFVGNLIAKDSTYLWVCLMLGPSAWFSGVTSSAAELNILDGVTATTAEINKLAGNAATAADLTKLAALTGTAAEINAMTDNIPMSVTYTITPENANAVKIAGAVLNGAAVAMNKASSLLVYFSDNADGTTLQETACDGAVQIETDGLAIPLIAKKCFQVITEADGHFKFTMTESGAKTAYLVTNFPDGHQQISDVLSWAA